MKVSLSLKKKKKFPKSTDEAQNSWRRISHIYTTKNSTIGRVSTVPVTVDTRPISHVYTVHVARRGRITVGRV